MPASGVASPYANAGQWGGVFVGLNATASLDNVYLGFAGGTTPIEGGFADFNPLEVHRGNLRLANSRLEYNATRPRKRSNEGYRRLYFCTWEHRFGFSNA